MAGERPASPAAKSWLYHPAFPEHWSRRALYSLARWVNGLAFRDMQFSESGKPVIKIAEIKGGISGQTKFTSQVFDESVHIRSGDLLFSWSGQPETSIDVFWWRGPDGWLNQHSFRVTPADGIDPTFFFYLLRYLKPNFIGIARNKQTTGLGHVTKRDLEDIEAAYPGLPEQRAIAHILGTLDDKIELNQRMSQTLEAMARALFKSWFVDFDPVRAKAEGRDPGLPQHLADLFPDSFEDSELGKIPKGWAISVVDDLGDVSSGKRPEARHSEASAGANVPLWGGNGPMAFVARALVEHPILLTGRVGTLGVVFRITTPCWPSDNTLIVHAKNAAAFEFLFFHLSQIDFHALNRGSTQPLLTQTDLKVHPLVVPPLEILAPFHRATRCLYRRVDEAHAESRSLGALRDALLPKLISGELPVTAAERVLKARA